MGRSFVYGPLSASPCQSTPLAFRPMTNVNANAAQWATSAANKFRAVARSTENPTTKELAEGLTDLAEAIRALDAR